MANCRHQNNETIPENYKNNRKDRLHQEYVDVLLVIAHYMYYINHEAHRLLLDDKVEVILENIDILGSKTLYVVLFNNSKTSKEKHLYWFDCPRKRTKQ